MPNDDEFITVICLFSAAAAGLTETD